MSYIEPHDTGRRYTGIGIVIVLHIVWAYAFLTGLARKIVEVVQAPLETRIIEEVKPPPPDKPPPPPPPKLAAPPPPFIPPPEIKIEIPVPPQNTITAVSTVKPVVEAPVPRIVPPVPAPVAPAPPARTAPVVDSRNCEKPDYPSASLRAQESGLVVLQFLIGTDGTAIESKIERSSGYRRLDEAARRALALCKFKPGTENGIPVQSWARIEYNWKLED